jgi:hypothetical protein
MLLRNRKGKVDFEDSVRRLARSLRPPAYRYGRDATAGGPINARAPFTTFSH